jgi:hypothetical protein
MLRPPKVATPFTAFTVTVPDRTAPLVPVPVVIASVTGAEDVVTVFPLASCTVTTGGVPKATPAVLLALGCVVNASFVATDALIKLHTAEFGLQLTPFHPMTSQ